MRSSSPSYNQPKTNTLKPKTNTSSSSRSNLSSSNSRSSSPTSSRSNPSSSNTTLLPTKTTEEPVKWTSRLSKPLIENISKLPNIGADFVEPQIKVLDEKNEAENDINEIQPTISNKIEYIIKQQDDNLETGELITNKMYLFITLHSRETDNQIHSSVINVFETVSDTQSNPFILTTTYQGTGSKELFDIKNMLKVNNAALKSKSIDFDRNNSEWTFGLNATYNSYPNFTPLLNANNGECVVFYVYNSSNTCVQKYYTTGSIFVYGNGVASTMEIRDFSAGNTEFEEASAIFEICGKKFVFNEPIINKMQTGDDDVVQKFEKFYKNANGINELKIYHLKTRNGTTVPVTLLNADNSKTDNIAINFYGPDAETNKKIFQNVTTFPKSQFRLTSVLKSNIPKTGGATESDMLYLNNVLPEKLYNSLNNNNKSFIPYFLDVVKYLYVDISMPRYSNAIQIETYTKLYKHIDGFQTMANTEIHNTELYREIISFSQYKSTYAQTPEEFTQKRGEPVKANVKLPANKEVIQEKGFLVDSSERLKLGSDNLKANMFIKYVNSMSVDKYNNVSFCMHYLDFVQFKSYLNTVKDQELIGLCNKITRKYNSININSIVSYIKNNITTDKHIYTFLKITNFESTSSNYAANRNKRYNILTSVNKNNNKKSIILKHFSTGKPFYKINGNLIMPNEDLNSLNTDPKNEKNKIISVSGNEVNVIKYDDSIALGPFNDVFQPSMQNADLIKQNKIQSLIDKLLAKKPVFIMGYGTSGSGKTSTLIYRNETTTDGIIMELCKKMGQEYPQVKVEYVEMFKPYYVNDTDKTEYNVKDPVINRNNIELLFSYENVSNSYKSINEIKISHYHNYRHNSNEKYTIFPSDTEMGKVLKFIIDTDRLVKATPNNPNSSRSHMLCFLKFMINETDNSPINPILIIGDLAGVENKFNCNNQFVLNKFYNVKREGLNSRFYQDEFYKESENSEAEFDIIYGGSNVETINDIDKYQRLFQNDYFEFNRDTITKLYAKYTDMLESPSTSAVRLVAFVDFLLKKVGLSLDNINDQIINNSQDVLTNIQKLNKIDNLTSEDWLQLMKIVYSTGRMKSLLTEYNKEIEELQSKNIGQKPTDKINEYDRVALKALKLIASDNPTDEINTSEYVQLLIKKVIECVEINKYLKLACEHRKVEGEYINASLQDLIADIKLIMEIKLSDQLYFLPNIIDKCYSQYESFKINSFTEINPKFKSDIINEIIKKCITDDSKKTGTEFANDIEICIFGVFNWSRKLIDPPPVPYVNINPLLQYIYGNNQFTFDMVIFKSRLDAIIKLLEERKTSAYALYVLNSIKTELLPSTTIDSTIEAKILKKLQLIENRNALTAIGTVEFLDRISKVSTMHSSCILDSDDGYIEIEQLKHLQKQLN